MSITLTSQQIKSENSDISSENEELTDDGENEIKSNIDFSYRTEEENDLDIDDDGDDEEVTKVQNTAITMPQDLRKSDKLLPTCNKKSEYDSENPNLGNSPKSSWQHCDGSFMDEDVYTISAAGQALPNSSLQITSIDGFFNRKRGRPPKNRFVEVYKNTHQKPQAIFTSFKLEKQEKSDATNYENSLNYCLQSGVETVKGCDNDNNTIEYPRHKPNTNSTHRKRLNKVNLTSTMLSTTSGRNKTFVGNSKELNVKYDENDDDMLSLPKSYKLDNTTSPINEHLKSSTAVVNADENVTSKSMSLDSLPVVKKPKISGAKDHVTVVRAAGTFYPENSTENSKAVRNCKKKISDHREDKESETFLGKEDLQFPNPSDSDKNVVQNLSLKDTAIFDAGCLESPSAISAASLAANPSVLPQIYSVLQMQQQLFAFYHQMALMTPAFSHMDLKTLLLPTLSHTTATALSSPSSSTSSVTGAEPDVTPQNKDLINMILSLKKQQANQKNNSSDLATATIPEGRVRPIHKRTVSSTVTSSSRGNNHYQHVTSIKDSPDSMRNLTPAEKLPEPQFSYGRESIPSGYLRFRFNEDCGYNKCGYRQHQSHFHCNRTDCQYSFCDKTRFVQHTARHERLDTLMGSDFQQYRSTMTCNYSNCPYAFSAATEDSHDILNGRKSSHFHCLKCSFVCADTNKVVAHRRLHHKMDFIRLAGFRKVTSNENCMLSSALSETKKYESNIIVNSQADVLEMHKSLAAQSNAGTNNHPAFENEPHCPYAMRHAHYHCLICNSSVLSRSQLLVHKHRNPGTTNTTQPSETTTLLSDNTNSSKSK